jgi:hypothetical protein
MKNKVRVQIGDSTLEWDWPVLQQGADGMWCLTSPEGWIERRPDREGLEEYAKLLYGNVVVIENSAFTVPASGEQTPE